MMNCQPEHLVLKWMHSDQQINVWGGLWVQNDYKYICTCRWPASPLLRIIHNWWQQQHTKPILEDKLNCCFLYKDYNLYYSGVCILLLLLFVHGVLLITYQLILKLELKFKPCFDPEAGIPLQTGVYCYCNHSRECYFSCQEGSPTGPTGHTSRPLLYITLRNLIYIIYYAYAAESHLDYPGGIIFLVKLQQQWMSWLL